MNDATRGADSIRNDISALAQRYAIIERDEGCGVSFFFLFLRVVMGRSPVQSHSGACASS